MKKQLEKSLVTGIAQKASQLDFHFGPLGKMIYRR